MGSRSLVSALRRCARRTVRSHGRAERRSDAGVAVMRGKRHALSRRASSAVAVLSLAFGVIACSGDDDGDAATTSAVALTTATQRSSTTVPGTTPATTTSSSTSISTTVDPAAKAEADVRAAIALAQDTFSACLVAMPTCDPSTLAVARADGLLERNEARINEWNAAGYTVRNRDQFRYVVEKVTLAPSGTAATALVCIADGSDLVKPGAGPGGADVIVDDSYTSGRESWDIRLDSDGRWRVYDGTAVGPTESSDVCPRD